MRKQVLEDGEWQQLKEVTLQHFPDHKSLFPHSYKNYCQVLHNLTVDEGLIVHGCCQLIPSTMQKGVLKELHKARQEAMWTKQQACLRAIPQKTL